MELGELIDGEADYPNEKEKIGGIVDLQRYLLCLPRRSARAARLNRAGIRKVFSVMRKGFDARVGKRPVFALALNF